MQVDEAERTGNVAGRGVGVGVGVMVRRGSRFRYRAVVRVLVASGNLEQLDRLADAFGQQAIQLVPVVDGRSAITEIAASHASIDAVVIDPDLTGVTSEEVITVLRAIDRDLAILVWSCAVAEVVEQVLELLRPDLSGPGHS